MLGNYRSTFNTLLGVICCIGIFVLPSNAQSLPVNSPVQELRSLALKQESTAHWDKALRTWLQVIALDRNNLEAKEHVQVNLRYLLQTRRQEDPEYRKAIMKLTRAEVFGLYRELLDKLADYYIDADKVTPGRLFDQGMNEFLHALSNSKFVSQYTPSATTVELERFRTQARQAWLGRTPKTADDAVGMLDEVCSAARRFLGLKVANAVVFEFICGASNSLDMFSAYEHHPVEEAKPLDLTVIANQIDDELAVIQIKEFNKHTPNQLREALDTLVGMQGIEGLVIDLRGNPGGSLQAAAKCAERFLTTGLIVSTNGRVPDFNDSITANDPGAIIQLPIVILVDGETASAAEVFAFALRDHKRAHIVGTTTYGKGTVQGTIRLPALGKNAFSPSIRMTIARLASPHGTSFHGTGLTPDVIETNTQRQSEIAIQAVREMVQSKSMNLMPMGP